MEVKMRGLQILILSVEADRGYIEIGMQEVDLIITTGVCTPELFCETIILREK